MPWAFPKWNKRDVDNTQDCTGKKEAKRQVSGIEEEAGCGDTPFLTGTGEARGV